MLRDGEGARLELWAQEHPDDAVRGLLIRPVRADSGIEGFPFDLRALKVSVPGGIRLMGPASQTFVDPSAVPLRPLVPGPICTAETRERGSGRGGSGVPVTWLPDPAYCVYPRAARRRTAALRPGREQRRGAGALHLLPIAVELYTVHRLSPSTLRAEVRITEPKREAALLLLQFDRSPENRFAPRRLARRSAIRPRRRRGGHLRWDAVAFAGANCRRLRTLPRLHILGPALGSCLRMEG